MANLNDLDEGIEKDDAIACINREMSLSLTDDEVTFANINKNEKVWWLDPANNKFNNDHYIALYDRRKRTLNVFLLPANTVKDPETTFSQRIDKASSSIEIPIDDRDFTDEKGRNSFSFKPYLVKQIQL